MQARHCWTPSSGGRSLLEAEGLAQSFSVGSRKEDSRSYLTDPSAKACRADDQRSTVAAYFLDKFSKKIVFTMNGVNRGAQ